MATPSEVAREAVPAVLPVTDDLDTGEFFAAAGRGELVVCECSNCGCVLHMPMQWCHRCSSADVRWRVVRPSGTIFSFSVVAHQIHPAFPAPYTVILVDLDDAPEVRLVGRLAGRPAVSIGDPVLARFVPIGDGAGLPEWELDNHPDD